VSRSVGCTSLMPIEKPVSARKRDVSLASRSMHCADAAAEWSRSRTEKRPLFEPPPRIDLSSTPQMCSEFWKQTYPSSGHMCSGSGDSRFVLYDLLRVSMLTRMGERLVGRSSTVKICLPVHISTGLMMAGGGSSTASAASPRYAASRANCERVRKTPCRVSTYAPVRKSCVAATTISPLRGVTRFSSTPSSSSDSARASSVCGRCRFISSPSKSALYGAHTHSLKRNVRPDMTRARCAMIDSLCSDGCRLKSTTSPSVRWRSTTSPTLSSDATRRRSPYLQTTTRHGMS
jgi:hypothetical protein